MVLQKLCPPALIYLMFSITQISIDIAQGSYNTTLVKIWVALVFTILLNHLCISGLDIVSWLIVFIPFILMTVITSMLLVTFGLDPRTGKLKIKYDSSRPQRPDIRNEIRNRRHKLDRFTTEEYAKWKRYKEKELLNIDYDKSNISLPQKEVLDDAVEKRANLKCDPLHSECAN
jgi:hypothetical protein